MREEGSSVSFPPASCGKPETGELTGRIVVALKKVSRFIAGAEAVCLATLVVLMVFFYCEAVASRYLGGMSLRIWKPLLWTEPISAYLLVIVGMVGAAAGTRKGVHILVDVLPHFIRNQLALDVIKFVVDLIGVGGVCILIYLGYKFAVWATGSAATIPFAPWFPMIIPRVSILVGFILVGGHYVSILAEDFTRLSNKSHLGRRR